MFVVVHAYIAVVGGVVVLLTLMMLLLLYCSYLQSRLVKIFEYRFTALHIFKFYRSEIRIFTIQMGNLRFDSRQYFPVFFPFPFWYSSFPGWVYSRQYIHVHTHNFFPFFLPRGSDVQIIMTNVLPPPPIPFFPSLSLSLNSSPPQPLPSLPHQVVVKAKYKSTAF